MFLQIHRIQTGNEIERRFSKWKQNVNLINKHNEEFSMGLHSNIMAANQYADWTREEYQQMMLTYKRKGRSSFNGITDSTTFYKPLPKNVDWKAQGYVTEVGNQAYKCRYRKEDSGATCTGYVDLPKGNETALQEAVAFVGPVAVAVDASHEGFMLYKSGVYDDNKCSSKIIDHSLLIVGYGIEDGKEYYNCKNSWGTSLGDKGYIKMVRNKNNQCGIATEASYPTM